AVQIPGAPMVSRDKLRPSVEPSAEVADFERKRRNRLIISLWFSAICGLLISTFIDFPLAIPFLIFTGLAACVIGKAGQTTTLQFLFQRRHSVSDTPGLEKMQARRRQAEDAAQRLQEQYDRDAGNERWGAKRDELRNLKETYENLPQIREFKFSQLARKDQLDNFIDKFEINHPDIAGIGDNAIVNLYSYGVETAADISEERLGQIPGLNESRVKRLIRWRQELEQKFVFDPGRRLAPEPRVTIEKEIDSLRLQLEHELSGGAHYLLRVKEEIETKRKELRPALLKARKELAQADKDLEIANKRNPFAPILLVLVIAFFIGISLKSGSTQMNIPETIPKREIVEQHAPSQPVGSLESDRTPDISHDSEAMSFYRRGTQLSRQMSFREAAKAFRNAVNIDPEFKEAYVELGYVLYRLKRYEESADASKEAIRIHGDFSAYYNLGLVHIATGNWNGAMLAFRRATELRDTTSAWKDEFTQ